MFTNNKNARPVRTEQDGHPTQETVYPYTAALDGIYVLIVVTETNGEPRPRRRIYLSLNSAQRAADRAVMRGESAAVVLAQLSSPRIVSQGVGR